MAGGVYGCEVRQTWSRCAPLLPNPSGHPAIVVDVSILTYRHPKGVSPVSRYSCPSRWLWVREIGQTHSVPGPVSSVSGHLANHKNNALFYDDFTAERLAVLILVLCPPGIPWRLTLVKSPWLSCHGMSGGSIPNTKGHYCFKTWKCITPT